MKKIISTLTLLSLTIFFLSGCSGGYSESVTIDFRAELSSGYTWLYETKNPEIVKVIEISDFDCDDDDEVCEGYQNYKLEGISEGKTTISFKYYSEDDNKITRSAVYEVVVNKNLKIKTSKKA